MDSFSVRIVFLSYCLGLWFILLFLSLPFFVRIRFSFFPITIMIHIWAFNLLYISFLAQFNIALTSKYSGRVGPDNLWDSVCSYVLFLNCYYQFCIWFSWKISALLKVFKDTIRHLFSLLAFLNGPAKSTAKSWLFSMHSTVFFFGFLYEVVWCSYQLFSTFDSLLQFWLSLDEGVATRRGRLWHACYLARNVRIAEFSWKWDVTSSG